MSEPTAYELSERTAILEERMNTVKAEHESALQALRTDMKQLDADMAKRDAEMAKRDAESARRDKENFRWLIGLWIATVVLLGVLVRWPS